MRILLCILFLMSNHAFANKSFLGNMKSAACGPTTEKFNSLLTKIDKTCAPKKLTSDDAKKNCEKACTKACDFIAKAKAASCADLSISPLCPTKC